MRYEAKGIEFATRRNAIKAMLQENVIWRNLVQYIHTYIARKLTSGRMNQLIRTRCFVAIAYDWDFCVLHAKGSCWIS